MEVVAVVLIVADTRSRSRDGMEVVAVVAVVAVVLVVVVVVVVVASKESGMEVEVDMEVVAAVPVSL